MPYTALKFLAYALAWTMPAVLLHFTLRRVDKSSLPAAMRCLIWVLLIPLAWLLGLGCAFLGHFRHEAAWLQTNPAGIRTEADMVTLGDYPNVFALWLLAGWIPVAIGQILARRAGFANRETRSGSAVKR